MPRIAVVVGGVVTYFGFVTPPLPGVLPPTWVLADNAPVAPANTQIGDLFDGVNWTGGPQRAQLANLVAMLAAAQNQLANNVAYLAIGSPTTPQAVAQVHALTQQIDALARLYLGLYDATS